MFNTNIQHISFSISNDGRILKLIILLSIEIVALFGNIFFIVAVFYRRPITKQSRTYIYLAFVSLSNLGAAIFVIPLPIITLATEEWVLGDGYCYATGYMSSLWLTLCVYSITMLSLHKYCSIVRPMRRGSNIRKAMVYRVLFTVLLSIVVTTIPFITNQVYFNPYTAHCAIKIQDLGYVLYIVFSVYIAPTFINILVYCRIFIALRQHSRRLKFTSVYSPRLLASQKKMMKTLYIVFSSFLFSWTPFFIYAILYSVKHESTSSRYFLVVAYIAGFSNSAVNPLIFIFRNLSIRSSWSSIYKNRQIPRLSLVPSLSRTQIEERAGSHFIKLQKTHSAEHNGYFAEHTLENKSVVLTSFKETDEIEIKFRSTLELTIVNRNAAESNL